MTSEGEGQVKEHPDSPLAGLRARLKDKQLATTIDIPLPAALEEELAVRFHALAWERSEKIAGQDRPGPRAKVELCIDELVHACECVLVREDGKWVELLDEGRKVRFDSHLAEALGVPGGKVGGQRPDIRLIVRGVFAVAAGGHGEPRDGQTPEELWEAALDHADHLIDAFHTQYRIWLRGGIDLNDLGAQGRTEEELLGE
jgi:hypothetical protein